MPTDFEIEFSRLRADGNAGFGVVELADDMQLLLRGRIDRVDTYASSSGICVKIIDYKSGSTDFDLIRLYNGLQLQLAVYMDAAMELTRNAHAQTPVVPAGILYYHIDDPVLETKEGLDAAEAEHALMLALRPDGLINREEEIYRAMDAQVEGRSEVIPLELKNRGSCPRRVHMWHPRRSLNCCSGM